LWGKESESVVLDAPASSAPKSAAKSVVALFNSSDDTVDMVRRMLDASGSGFATLIGCRLADLKKGRVDFERYVALHQGLVLTTTSKDRLDETVGRDSEALEIVGKPYDLRQIESAIRAAMKRASTGHAARPH
jgi:hypothetical protein